MKKKIFSILIIMLLITLVFVPSNISKNNSFNFQIENNNYYFAKNYENCQDRVEFTNDMSKSHDGYVICGRAQVGSSQYSDMKCNDSIPILNSCRRRKPSFILYIWREKRPLLSCCWILFKNGSSEVLIK